MQVRLHNGRLMGWVLVLLLAFLSAGVGILLYLALVPPAMPLERHRLVVADVTGDWPALSLFVSREMCFAGPSEAETVRTLRRLLPAGGSADVMLVGEAPTLARLDGGCYLRARRVTLPPDMEPGRYAYQTGLRWCNALGHCRTEWLPPVLFDVDGQGPGMTGRVDRAASE